VDVYFNKGFFATGLYSDIALAIAFGAATNPNNVPKKLRLFIC